MEPYISTPFTPEIWLALLPQVRFLPCRSCFLAELYTFREKLMEWGQKALIPVVVACKHSFLSLPPALLPFIPSYVLPFMPKAVSCTLCVASAQNASELTLNVCFSTELFFWLFDVISAAISHSLFPNCSIVTSASVRFNQASHPALYCCRVNQSSNHIFPSTFFTKGASPRRLVECISTASLPPALMNQGLTAWGYVSLLRPWDSDYGQCSKLLMCKHTRFQTPTSITICQIFCQVKVERVGRDRHGSRGPWATSGMSQTATRGSVISSFLPCTSFLHCVPPLSVNTEAHSCSAADAWFRCWQHTF